ncbi:MAG TPA: prepilin-type N-terminal cleavage/methylation domain-containing protein [Pyrinomonadaceae bacterium]
MRRATRINGFTLIELVITVAVLAILTLGVIPLMRVSVKRQKEEQLRAALREMREAIDQFHREALMGASMQAIQQAQSSTAQQEQAPRSTAAQTQQNIFADPRVRVFITDQTIFSSDNPDRYPPDLETLVDGVDVLPLTLPAQLQGGQGITGAGILERTENSAIPKTKIYLRQLPIDPMTGKADWCVSSSYEPAEDSKHGCHSSGDGENVFNVHSRSEGEALDGTKYRDW